MASIDDFKAQLKGGGARPNQFRVTIVPPIGIVTGLNVANSSFLCKASKLPGQTLGEIEVPFRGRKIYVAGDREFETWNSTFLNDTDFNIRNAIERWMNGINDLADNTGTIVSSDYQSDLTVEQLDRDGTTIKSYIFRNAYPLTLADIELSYETVNALEEFEVTWRYQHFEASGVNF
jgi:hypothetical protein|tara:strand:- start:767 stop:1297 length:531 start_codon:yes stop_codon:yes gene_type:complete